MERRFQASEFQHEGKTLRGYAAVWDSPTKVTERGRTFTEVVKRGAFGRTLAKGNDIVVSFNHDPGRILGRTSAGTARVTEDIHGLRFEVDLPDHAADIREMVERGDLRGASFAFSIPPGGDYWANGTRELRDVDLTELGPVVMPAYGSTSVGLRSRPLWQVQLELAERA